MFGRDKSSTQVAVAHSLGLPPRRVILGHHLQDVATFEGKTGLLAWRRFVLQGDVVEQGSQVHLGPVENSRIIC